MLTININPCLPPAEERVKDKLDLVPNHCPINVCEAMEVKHHTCFNVSTR